MNSSDIRQQFLSFFKKKNHRIVDSAPMVTKDDPTLMFTNAGMNQFKEHFLGHKSASHVRVADTQKCLRVSGKHNDLEEVGIDGYHHTMFEMLGNWSFGDYFKEEAISWAWELLTKVYGLPEDRFYVSIFGGDKQEGLEEDSEARSLWEQLMPADRVPAFGKKDNFWEMGDTGPCGPCSEIHIDLRSDDDRAKVDGRDLVNTDHPEVIELWNLVFIQYNRKADGSLENLPDKHVDTGLGFERLSMVVQGKKSNYESDVFSPLIQFIEKKTGIQYTNDYSGDTKSDIAMRVVADHVRALFFGIIDGQLPSNTGAGYVLRRILRRAVRYYFSFLDVKSPLMHQIVPLLVEYFDNVFSGVSEQADFAAKVILEEEKSFLRTLDSGLKRFEKVMIKDGRIDGDEAFELYDTYGFPIDLTHLIAAERGLSVDHDGFKRALQKQKDRSRADAQKSVGDWIVVKDGGAEFVGFDLLEVEDACILRYREVESKGKKQFQLVLDRTPFYPEGGGQVGDRGRLVVGGEEIKILNSIKENDLPILVSDKLPADFSRNVHAYVNVNERHLTENNHTATHLLHAALRQVLGPHVQQKGSLVNSKHLRFDFAHFQKMTDDEVRRVEEIVNKEIRHNIPIKEDRKIPVDQARAAGAMMLFGEKYGDEVRMITFDPEYSVELCGGCHVPMTGQIGQFKITSESAIAAGVRRIEAISAQTAEKFINERLDLLHELKGALKNPVDPLQTIDTLLNENKSLQKELEGFKRGLVSGMRDDLISQLEKIGSVRFLAMKIEDTDSKSVKDLIFQITAMVENAVLIIGLEIEDKAQLHVGISKGIAGKSGLHAGQLIRELAKSVGGGGGGQPFYASAGGKNPSGIDKALADGRAAIESLV
jgi:alanyl-tRNA synthetase